MPALTPAARQRLVAVLERSAEAGWLGPGPVAAHVDHALAVAAALGELEDIAAGVLDLGSGGGVPGLAVAVALAPVPVTLLDGAARRCAFLRTAVTELQGLARLAVAEGRAEDLARDRALTGRFAVVTARSFGPPAVTAECGSRFVHTGGHLVVTEPPDPQRSVARWDEAGLAALGLGAARIIDREPARLAIIPKVADTDERYPRRAGIPAKRPLW